MKFIFCFFFTHVLLATFAQDSTIWVSFHASPDQYLGFEHAKKIPASNYYPSFTLPNGQVRLSSYKILAYGKTDKVDIKLHGDSLITWANLEFYFGQEKIEPEISTSRSASLTIENPKKSNDILAYKNGRLVGQLKTMVYAYKKKKVFIIPVARNPINSKIIKKELNQVFKQANIALDVAIESPFPSNVFNTKTTFTPPDTLMTRYTGQMRLLRDQYFAQNPTADRNAFYLFVIPNFSNGQKTGYMVHDKSIGFVPFQSDSKRFSIQIARTLAMGIGALNNAWVNGIPPSSNNLMDTNYGVSLTHFQINELQRDIAIYSRIDAYENIKTGNGTIAYYFWEEDENGNIIIDGKNPVVALKQPFKKNFLAYRFDVHYSLMRPFFRFGKYYISILNFIFIFGIAFVVLWLRKRINLFWLKKGWRIFWRRSLFWISLLASIFLIQLSFEWGNTILDQFKKVSGKMPVLSGLTYHDAKKTLFVHPEIRKQGEANLFSEILIRKNRAWEVKKRAQVLYFDVQESDTSEVPSLRFTSSSDSLILHFDSIRAFARIHYSVYSFWNSKGERVRQEVYNYNGKKLTDFKSIVDIPRRVLVFANGYRPTSTGLTFGESFKGIQSKGFEFPNTKNYIYSFDRYDYWQPWGEINLQFQNRINPSITVYADGHFSVSTSDYQSLLNFTRISQLYPLRCKNKQKHTCYKVKNDRFTRFILPTAKTEKLLKMAANKNGFDYRKKKGKIAGMNLLQELNPCPNMSENDTLFIVAHSMGFAYALGMIDVLRNKINFGGFYIIAPENAKTGYVKPKEWQQIWQYGSRFNLTNSDAPCLQDGVAAQSAAKGLSYKNRVFIPENLYDKKGFFDSHFIGYYDWILKLKEGEKGYMQQR